MGHTMGHLNWYLFPKDIQRMLPTVMIVTQKVIVLRGFEDFSCTRGSFQNVCSIKIEIQTNRNRI